MTRRSRREIEHQLNGLERTEDPHPDNPLGELRIVRETPGGWVDSLTGEPVAVDEDRDLMIDFAGVDT
jgi:hypothetical protein